jgi:hypothetical protein
MHRSPVLLVAIAPLLVCRFRLDYAIRTTCAHLVRPRPHNSCVRRVISVPPTVSALARCVLPARIVLLVESVLCLARAVPAIIALLVPRLVLKISVRLVRSVQLVAPRLLRAWLVVIAPPLVWLRPHLARVVTSATQPDSA